MGLWKRASSDVNERMSTAEADLLNATRRDAIKTILATTDLSARSDRALDRAVELAVQHGARLVVTHIIDQDLPTSLQEQAAAAARQEMQTGLDKAGCPDDVQCAIEVMLGKDYRSILAAAETCDADLVIMGVHGQETPAKLFTGTTVERVIRNGRRPVLVVRDQSSGPYEKVLIGVDFSVVSRFALRAALAVAPSARFHAVHAFQVPFAGFHVAEDAHAALEAETDSALTALIDEEMGALIGGVIDQTEVAALERIVRNGEPRAALHGEVRRLRPQLLVLGTHGRVGLAHAIIGSVAEDFLTHPPCDVLAVKAW